MKSQKKTLKEVAIRRTNAVIMALYSLSKCAGKVHVKDAENIFKAIRERVDRCEEGFEQPDRPEPFTLEKLSQ